MAGPNPGNYYIVNSVLSPDGNQLATNLNGVNAPLVVVALAGLMAQQWTVTGEPNVPQRIAPLINPELEAGRAGNFAEALDVAGFTWDMTEDGDGYIIADPATNEVCAINIAAEGQQVVVEPRVDGSLLQVWRFLPA